MNKMAGVTAIVVGAGSGSRMGADKSFMDLAGKPVIAWPVEVLQRNMRVREIVLVLHKNRLEEGRSLAEKRGWSKVTRVCAGGSLRQDSVRNGLAGVTNSEFVLIHDAARPFLTDRLIDDGIKAAESTGSAVAAVPVKDTVKQVDENHIVAATLPRSRLMAVQTPQVFQYKILKEAYSSLDDEVTDDASAVERIGFKVMLYTGDYENIKITTREDLALAEIIAKRR
ncbi:MAG: 2-C-methyl-D-erythritol 4-phosphate cytidylyltransferase, partial [Chloroflexi bacterium]|nr:2-C-methyl-D-erythritol 4-phosphate cytidylyltransferase [Chloroflexota bacterium]